MSRRDGDWDCPNCNDMNFASRHSCRKCGTPKVGGAPRESGGGGFSARQHIKPGDWNCTQCNDHNFASRQMCRKCNAPKPAGATGAGYGGGYGGGGGRGASRKPGDWDCPNCNDLVFASRPACRRCGTAKPSVDENGPMLPQSGAISGDLGTGFGSSGGGWTTSTNNGPAGWSTPAAPEAQQSWGGGQVQQGLGGGGAFGGFGRVGGGISRKDGDW